MIHKKYILLIGGTLSCAFLLAYTDEYTQAVENARLIQYGQAPEKEKVEKPAPSFLDFFKAKKFEPEVQERHESEQQRLLGQAVPTRTVNAPAVIDRQTVEKMELVYNPAQPDKNLITYLTTITPDEDTSYSTLFTRNGTKAFSEILTQPRATYSLSKKNQAIVRTFYENERLLNAYSLILRNMQRGEEAFLDFYAEENPENEKLLDSAYFGAWFEEYNKNPYSLETRTRFYNLMDTLSIGHIPFLLWFGTTRSNYSGINSSTVLSILNDYMDDKLSLSEFKILDRSLDNAMRQFQQGNFEAASQFQYRSQPLFHNPKPSLLKSLGLGAGNTGSIMLRMPQYFYHYLKAISSIPHAGAQTALYGFTALALATESYTIYAGSSQAIFRRDVNNFIQGKMIGVATYVNSIKNLYLLAKQMPEIVASMPELELLECLVAPTNTKSAQFNQLIKLLDTNTFKGSPSFFSLMGRALATYKLMKDCKNEFAELLRVGGRLEAFYAMAQVVKAHENSPRPYSFVEFIKNDTAYILAEEFCNPFVPAQYVVPNSLEMKGDGSGHIILTGPNTGGKSTLIKGLWINALLAQTFGVAYAKRMVMTPFYKLSSYLNITDNVSEGLSLFKAEIKRARELRDTLVSLKPDQFMFIVMDEMFSGTAPEKAQDISYEFIENMSGFRNCLFIDATHFPKLTELESRNICSNYHMEIIPEILPNGSQKLKCTYKLLKGASQISNAQQLVREEGITW